VKIAKQLIKSIIRFFGKIILLILRFVQNRQEMKKGILLVFSFMAIVVLLASCYSGRKYGCPGNPQANYRFRG